MDSQLGESQKGNIMKLTEEERKNLINLISDYGKYSQDFGAASGSDPNLQSKANLVKVTYCRILDLIFEDFKDAH